MFTKSYINEIWKPVVGYEGLDEVSNFGRVKSLEREKRFCYNSIQHCKEIILKQKKTKDGYCQVTLFKNTKRKCWRVHRLVAIAFIPNPNNYSIVNHKDCNPLNNRVENLEWCTQQYNSTYADAVEKRAKKKDIPVLQFSMDGIFIREYRSATIAQEETKTSRSHICQCCKNQYGRKSAGGFIWKYKPQAS